MVLDTNFNHTVGNIPASYTLSLKKGNTLPKPPEAPRHTTINISNSTGIQVGDYNTQNLQIAVAELLMRIEGSDASSEEKEEAKSRLTAFLAHPLVASVLGGAASGLIALASGA